MKLQITNLGMIEQGEIALDKNLIVLTGPNHSAKSQLAYLLYGLLKVKHAKASNLLYEKYKNLLYQHFDQANILAKYTTKTGISVNLPAFYQENSELYTKVHNQTLVSSLVEVFASKYLCPDIQLVDNPKNPLLNTEYTDIVKLNGVSYHYQLNNEWFEFNSDEHQTDNLAFIKPYFYEAVTLSNNFNVYFFPAERLALNILSKEVVRERALERDDLSRRILANENLETVIKSLQQKGSLVPCYPLAVNDYIYFIDDLIYIGRNISEYAFLADEIENNLIQGKILLSEHGSLKYKINQQRMPMHLAASLVKSLAGLVVYFRHIAQKNDVIMLDEPELNLHPNNQIQIAHILAKAVTKGFKVILSTHSNYIIQEFKNLLMQNNSQNPDSLNPTEVDVYFCNENSIMSVTEKSFVLEIN